MKLTKIFIILFFIFAGLNLYAQQTKVIAIINKASWCPVCKANGEKVMMLMPEYMGKDITFLMNDLTDETTKKESMTELEKHNAWDFVKDYDKTGFITIVDTKSNKIIETISVSKSEQDLKDALNNALSSN